MLHQIYISDCCRRYINPETALAYICLFIGSSSILLKQCKYVQAVWHRRRSFSLRGRRAEGFMGCIVARLQAGSAGRGCWRQCILGLQGHGSLPWFSPPLSFRLLLRKGRLAVDKWLIKLSPPGGATLGGSSSSSRMGMQGHLNCNCC